MRSGLLLALVLSFLVVLTPTFAADPMVEKLAAQPVQEIPEVPMEVKTLTNGTLLYYAQSRELPIVHLSIFIDTGEIHEPKDLRGIASFFIAALRGGGAKSMAATLIDQKLETLAASITSDSEAELLSLNVRCLAKDVQPVLDILFRLIREPAFAEDRLGILRKNALYSILRRNEEPLPIAKREFEQSLYGKDSPQAWEPTEATINAITQAKLSAYYEQHVAPNRLRIAATSPLSVDDFQKLIEPHLVDWKKSLPKPEYPTRIKKQWQPTTEFIQKTGNQSSIVMGHFGELRFNPDKFKIILANEILGGSTFGARLGDMIRTRLGLAYSVGSGFGFGTDYGSFRIVVQTKSESTLRTIREIASILTTLVKEGVTEAELSAAKDKLLVSMVFEYETPFNIVQTNLRYDFFGYPKNYLAYYQKALRAVTVAEVNAALPQYLFPEQLKIMIVGDKTKIPDFAELKGLKEIPLDNE